MGNYWLKEAAIQNSRFSWRLSNLIEKTFDVWYEELCQYASKYGWEEYVREDKEAWRLAFDDGDTPEQAFLIDASYWEVEG